MRQANEWRGGHGNRLVDFVRLAGVEVPDDYADQQVTAVLRRVLEQSRRHARFGGYPQTIKDAWRRVLLHNRRDCRWARMFLNRDCSRARERGAAGNGAKRQPSA
jgi:hypothetical protein